MALVLGGSGVATAAVFAGTGSPSGGPPGRSDQAEATIISGPDGKEPDVTSILKLGAIPELARPCQSRAVKLNIVRDLLPAPGDLQKGISVPDERGASEAIVIDRNPSAARYLFNAYELQVSYSPRESEKALSDAIVEGLPRTKRAEAMKFVAAGLARVALNTGTWLRLASPRSPRRAWYPSPLASWRSGDLTASPSTPPLRSPGAVTLRAVPLVARSQPRPAPSPAAGGPSPAIGLACAASVRRPLAGRLPAARAGAVSADHLPSVQRHGTKRDRGGSRRGEIEESW